MKSSAPIYQPHLVLRQHLVQPGAEWSDQLSGCSLIHVARGTGYYLHPEMNRELPSGAVLLICGEMQGVVRASHLGDLSLYCFSVTPGRLSGILTVREQELLVRKNSCLEILPPDSPAAGKMKVICAEQNPGGLRVRLKLLQLFAEICGQEIEPACDGNASNARERLQAFLAQTPSSELLEMSFEDLVQVTRCTSRHLSRIFHELVGTSFRNKRSELRLSKARELLATTNIKIVDVALESGYKSLSLFNYMFSHRFGISPGKWREKYGTPLRRSKRAKLAGSMPAGPTLTGLNRTVPRPSPAVIRCA